MSAMRAGWYAFNERALIPTADYPWDDYTARLFRYALYEAYDTNTIYDSVTRFSTQLKDSGSLYAHVRGIYNPVARLNESYVDKIYGGALDFETLTTGAVPLVFGEGADETRLVTALRQVWLWSNLRINKDFYVRTGAKLGDVAWKIVDTAPRGGQRSAGKVYMEVVHPGKIASVTMDAVHNVKAVTLEYERTDAATGRDYLYREEIDGDWFRTYRDGQPYAYTEDASGTPVAEWRNPYGFVPLVLVQHRNVGLQWGANAFYAQVGKIDEINDAASLLNDSVRKVVNPMLKATGFRAGSTIQFETDNRDSVPVLYGPEGTTIEPLTPNINLADAGANVDRLLLELERDLPELALHRVREGGQLTAPGVRAAYADAVGRFKSAMSAYDDGLIRAQKMALSIGGFRGYEGFEGITLDSYAAGDLEHYIRDRAIIEDALSKQEKVTVLQALPDRPEVARLILEELGYNSARIDEVVSEIVVAAERETRAAVRGMAEAWFGAGPQGGDDSDNQQTEPTPGTPAQPAETAATGNRPAA